MIFRREKQFPVVRLLVRKGRKERNQKEEEEEEEEEEEGVVSR